MRSTTASLGKRGFIAFASIFLAATALYAPAAEADPAALVIGNRDYENAPDASDARRDARRVADALRDAGFDVFDGYDLGAAAMQDLLVRFEKSVRSDEEYDALVIFVSGQAVRADGRGYVAPTDLDPSTLTEVRLKAAPLDLFVDLASMARGRSVVLLDLSRPDGFEPNDIVEPGFVDLNDPDGVLVVSSAAPGEAIRLRDDGVSGFAEIAVDELLKPGAPANAAALALAARMRQERGDGPDVWVTGDADEEFTLVAAPEESSAELRAQMELEAWRAAEVSGDRSDYARYLDFFPDGSFADIAEQRIAKIDAAAAEESAARQGETALRLDAQERARVQALLNSMGFNTGGVDGVFGPASRRSIADWQRKRGDEATGYLTESQYAALRDQARQMNRDQRAERRAWDNSVNADTVDAYEAYLDDHPDGRQADEARRRIAQLGRQETAQTPSPQQAEAALELNRGDRVMVQQTLTAQGFDTRGVDGAFGPDSRSAIKRWQRDRGETATGYLTAGQFADLRDAARALRGAVTEDREDWRKAADADTIDAYEEYLRNFPEGEQADAARDRIAELHRQQAEQSEPRQIEAALELSRGDRIAVQRALTQRGYDTRGVDGAFGPGSRRAISLWQRDRGETSTGYLTGDQFAALVQTNTAPPPQYEAEEDEWRRAVDRNSEDAYRDYLRRYPNGRYAAEAERRIADLRYRSQDIAIARNEEQRQNFSDGQRRSIEGRLATLGYNPGSQDGRFTDRTREAIAEFQRAQGILDSGYADRATVQALVDLTPQVTQQEMIGSAIEGIFRQLDN